MDLFLPPGAGIVRSSMPNWQETQRICPKLFRAFELLAYLRSQLMHHTPHSWVRLAVEDCADHTSVENLVLQDSSDEQMSLEWALGIGDALHNARSALDHAIWQLVHRNGHTPDPTTQFPTAREESAFSTRRLRGAHQYVHDAVRALEPWEGGKGHGHWLWVVTQLDNVVSTASCWTSEASRT